MTSVQTEFFSGLQKHRHDHTVVEFYNKHAKNYENAHKDGGYQKIIDYSAVFLKDLLLEESSDIPAEKFEILDVGCGSGMTGKALQKTGFQYFDGIDASPKMLDLAKEKKIYRNLLKGKLTGTETFDIIKDEQYDGLLGVGVIGGGHIKLKHAIPEFLRLLKDGGIAVYTISPTIDQTKALEEHLIHFYEGKFELLKIERKFFAVMPSNRGGNYCHLYGIRKV